VETAVGKVRADLPAFTGWLLVAVPAKRTGLSGLSSAAVAWIEKASVRTPGKDVVPL
jgi:hypothetical protein